VAEAVGMAQFAKHTDAITWVDGQEQEDAQKQRVVH
jgi:hypothetical protein